jgi:hypothetical protein
LSLLLYPLMDRSPQGRLLFGGVAVVVVPLAVWVVNRSPAYNAIGWLLAVPSLVLTLWGVFVGDERLIIVSASLEALLYFYAAAGLIAYMLRDVHVTDRRTVRGRRHVHPARLGLCLRLLRVPGDLSRQLQRAVEPERDRTWVEFLFLSFTNLSATGLGDILPLSAPRGCSRCSSSSRAWATSQRSSRASSV